MENKKSNITFFTVVLLIITIISISAVLGMYKMVKEENEKSLSQGTTNVEENVEKSIDKEEVKEFLDIFYFMGDDTIIPSFNDINTVEEDWIWLAAYFNLFSDEQDPGLYVTKERVEESAKEIFGENLNKEFPTEGLEFWLEPKDGKYFVTVAGLDPDYINDFEIIDIKTDDDEITVDIAEYKYNVLRDDIILEIINIENNKTVAKLNKEDYAETDPELFESTRIYETISSVVTDNIEQFSTAQLTLKINEQTGKLYIVALERKNQDKSETTGKYINYAIDSTSVENEYGEEVTPANTLEYSVLKEYNSYLDNGKFVYGPFNNEGNSAAWEEIESNYDVENLIIKVGKYTNTIEAKCAVLNEAGNYRETMSLKEKVTEMYKSIKNNDLYENDKYKITGICIMNGNTESEEEYNNNSRAKKIKVTVNNEKEYTFELEDTNKPQLFDMEVIQSDMSEPMTVKIEVLETYQGLKSDDVYITEIGFGFDNGGLGAR